MTTTNDFIARIANTPYWNCAVCGKRVTQHPGHAQLRVRRGNGWDHARCHPAPADTLLAENTDTRTEKPCG